MPPLVAFGLTGAAFQARAREAAWRRRS